MRHILIIVLLTLLSLSATAAVKSARWTGADDSNGSFAHVIAVANSKTGLNLSANDFVQIEDRDFAT